MAPESDKRSKPSRRFVAPVICFVLLAGLATDRILFHLVAGNSEEYHAAVKAAVNAIPEQIGDWVGKEVPVPAEARKLLDANVILSRAYLNARTMAAATLLIVHCRDARDMGSHYPPVCYPSNGWELPESGVTDRDWTVGEMPIGGREYNFESGRFDRTVRLIVYNFILRPDGMIERDIKGLRRAGYDPRKKPFGGGQVQLVFDGQTKLADREMAVADILSACLPAIQTVLSGRTK